MGVKIKMRVFLGGTCGNSTWRGDLIPLLESNNIDYFNPVVEGWTPECIEIEENEKDNICDVHLFLITSEMKGVYSIAEMMASIIQKDKKTLFVVISEGFNKSQIKSLVATSEIARKYGDNFYSHFMNKEEGLDVVVDMIKPQ